MSHLNGDSPFNSGNSGSPKKRRALTPTDELMSFKSRLFGDLPPKSVKSPLAYPPVDSPSPAPLSDSDCLQNMRRLSVSDTEAANEITDKNYTGIDVTDSHTTHFHDLPEDIHERTLRKHLDIRSLHALGATCKQEQIHTLSYIDWVKKMYQLPQDKFEAEVATITNTQLRDMSHILFPEDKNHGPVSGIRYKLKSGNALATHSVNTKIIEILLDKHEELGHPVFWPGTKISFTRDDIEEDTVHSKNFEKWFDILVDQGIWTMTFTEEKELPKTLKKDFDQAFEIMANTPISEEKNTTATDLLKKTLAHDPFNNYYRGLLLDLYFAKIYFGNQVNLTETNQTSKLYFKTALTDKELHPSNNDIDIECTRYAAAVYASHYNGKTNAPEYLTRYKLTINKFSNKELYEANYHQGLHQDLSQRIQQACQI